MKTDRELLELAAKAAGYKGLNYDGLQWEACAGDRGILVPWNPLKYDGDNARLETKLEIEVRWHEDGVEAGKRGDAIGVYVFYEETEYDKDKARRLASVNFAAAMGEAMQ